MSAGRPRRAISGAERGPPRGGAGHETTCPTRRLAMIVTLLVLTLRGPALAQTPPPTPTPSATRPQVDRLQVAVQLEREQNDPILMTLVYATQYAPVYEALVEEDPWHH